MAVDSRPVLFRFPVRLLDRVDAVAPRGQRTAWVVAAVEERLAREVGSAVESPPAVVESPPSDDPVPPQQPSPPRVAGESRAGKRPDAFMPRPKNTDAPKKPPRPGPRKTP